MHREVGSCTLRYAPWWMFRTSLGSSCSLMTIHQQTITVSTAPTEHGGDGSTKHRRSIGRCCQVQPIPARSKTKSPHEKLITYGRRSKRIRASVAAPLCAEGKGREGKRKEVLAGPSIWTKIEASSSGPGKKETTDTCLHGESGGHVMWRPSKSEQLHGGFGTC
jgi:hypothetical protein